MNFDKVTKPTEPSNNILSSPEEIRNFLKSSIYSDFINELEIRIEMLTALQDDFELKYTGRAYDMFRGGKFNLLQMKEIFPEMLENKLNDLDLKEGKSNA